MTAQRLELYRHLRRIRLLDERLVQLQRQGRVAARSFSSSTAVIGVSM